MACAESGGEPEQEFWIGALCGSEAGSGTCVDFCFTQRRQGIAQRRKRMDMSENEIAAGVVAICFKIHVQYGPGLFESVYEVIFIYEWMKSEIGFERQKGIKVI